MMLIDSHAHLEMPEFEGDLEEVIQRAKESGVEYIFTVGTEKKDGGGPLRLPIPIPRSMRFWVFIPTMQRRLTIRPIRP